MVNFDVNKFDYITKNTIMTLVKASNQNQLCTSRRKLAFHGSVTGIVRAKQILHSYWNTVYHDTCISK